MDAITVNGVEYVPKASAPEVVDSEHVCVIATNGWIFEGHCVEREDGDGRTALVLDYEGERYVLDIREDDLDGPK